jgi:predicted transposase YbfD/YdcC
MFPGTSPVNSNPSPLSEFITISTYVMVNQGNQIVLVALGSIQNLKDTFNAQNRTDQGSSNYTISFGASPLSSTSPAPLPRAHPNSHSSHSSHSSQKMDLPAEENNSISSDTQGKSHTKSKEGQDKVESCQSEKQTALPKEAKFEKWLETAFVHVRFHTSKLQGEFPPHLSQFSQNKEKIQGNPNSQEFDFQNEQTQDLLATLAKLVDTPSIFLDKKLKLEKSLPESAKADKILPENQKVEKGSASFFQNKASMQLSAQWVKGTEKGFSEKAISFNHLFPSLGSVPMVAKIHAKEFTFAQIKGVLEEKKSSFESTNFSSSSKAFSTSEQRSSSPFFIPQSPTKLDQTYLSRSYISLEGKIFPVDERSNKSRNDQILPIEKQTKPSGISSDEEFIVYRFPPLPDQPVSRQRQPKPFEKGNQTRQLDVEGYQLNDMILMLFCAVLCGARTLTDIFNYLDVRAAFFITWLGLRNGIPSVDILKSLLMRLNPISFKEMLAFALGLTNSSMSPLVRVWDSGRGILLGFIKSPEFSGNPFLADTLRWFDLEKSLVTLDLLQLDLGTCSQIIQQGGDYFVRIKGIHEKLYKQVQDFFEGSVQQNPQLIHDISQETINQNQRIESRHLILSRHLDWCDEISGWEKLRTVIRFEAECIIKSQKINERRYYFSSVEKNAKEISEHLRLLLGLDNQVSWIADLDFASHPAALAIDHTGLNMAHLNQYALHLLQRNSNLQGPLEAKRKAILANPRTLATFISAL